MFYQVNEIFKSIQGEGYWSGVPCTFIRLQGCPVGCEWCDTKYTWGKGGTRMELDEITEGINAGEFVVITGGEPLLYDLDPLLWFLQSIRCYVQIETSGYAWYKGKEHAQWLTWSPKPKLNWWAPYELFRNCREIKFVVDDQLTATKVKEVLERAAECTRYDGPTKQVTFMPEGTPPSKQSMEKALALAEAFGYWNKHMVGTVRVCDRLQFRLGVK